MNNNKNIINENKGITLIALVITIVVLLILAAVTITPAISGAEEANYRKYLSELEIVQHAVVERYTKYKLTKDESLLLGEASDPKAPPQENNISWKKQDGYYELRPDNLINLGITDAEDTYIVNYETGEVYNYSIKKVTIDNNEEILYKSLN